ncbi:MAG: class I SAM-dependent methyltransferase [Gammaproteobacteria bacterium]
MKRADELSDGELRELFHNDHEQAFAGYLRGSAHAQNKEAFLLEWVAPAAADHILECGSSSGKTCIALARHAGCRCLGVDFDPEAVRIASALRDEHFPALRERCAFAVGDLTSMRFDEDITKVLMPDFTEHVPDRVLRAILRNLREQLPAVELYIYTPSRSHVFEILKHRGIILSNPPGHINVKTRAALTRLLVEEGWVIVESGSHYSSMWYVRPVERLLRPLPVIGKYFDRRLALRARPAAT